MSDLAPISIVIADDHPIFLEGLKLLIHEVPDMRVVGTATTGRAAIDVVRTLKPDVLLLDLAMPQLSGLEVLRELHGQLDRAGHVRVVMLTAGIDDDQQLAALEEGACGILLKQAAAEVLFKCIRTVMAGQYWVGREAVASVVAALRRARVQTSSLPFDLTARQWTIVQEVVAGATNRDIAGLLNMREDTVKHHLSSIYDKCGVSNRVELAMFAVNHGLLKHE
jgi:two-component system, NarL family, nitrate/nitrite response regulator NarL